MGTSKDKFQKASKPLVDTYNEMQLGIFKNIAKETGKDRTLFLNDIEEWAEKRLSSNTPLQKQNEKTIRMLSSKGADAMEDGLWDASMGQLEDSEERIQTLLKRAGQESTAVDLRKSEQIMSILENYQRQAVDTLNMTNSGMLSKSEQVYRDIINRVTADVLTGVHDRHSALKFAVRDWSRRGLPALVDKAGRTWNAESYVRTVIRTTSNKVTQEMQEQRYDEHGIRLIEVSSHQGARPNCEPYQGRVFARGEHPRYPDFYTETSYGEPDGILGINCHHVTYPFMEGVSTKRFEGYDSKRNESAYENSQTQRSLERGVKEAKTELEMMEQIGNEELIDEAKKRVREQQAKVRSFTRATGRKRRYNREQVYT